MGGGVGSGGVRYVGAAKRVRQAAGLAPGVGVERMAEWPAGPLFVVYCAGPHCNGADQAVLRLAGLGCTVKLMLDGMTDWADEGFTFAPS